MFQHSVAGDFRGKAFMAPDAKQYNNKTINNETIKSDKFDNNFNDAVNICFY